MDLRMTEQITRLKRLMADLERLDAGAISAATLMAIPVLGMGSQFQTRPLP